MRENKTLIDIQNRIFEIDVKLDKAGTIINDLCQDYFGHTDVNPVDLKKEALNSNTSSACVLYEYGGYSNKSFIVSDYVWDARNALKELDNSIDEFRAKDTAEPHSQVDAIVAMLYTIHDPKSIQRVYDFVYRIFTKAEGTGAVPEKAGQGA
jgi:hypothetical protein